MRRCDLALIFPPLWYFSAVPGGLTELAGPLRGAGHEVQLWDLSAKTNRDLVGRSSGFLAFQQGRTFSKSAHALAASQALDEATEQVGQAFGVRYDFRQLQPRGGLSERVSASREFALDPARNPAFNTLKRAVEQVLASAPRVIGLCVGHPDQLPQVFALAALLRAHAYDRPIVLYGALEDVVAVTDLAGQLRPGHRLFDHLSGALAGDPLPGLLDLLNGASPIRGWVGPSSRSKPVNLGLKRREAARFEGLHVLDYPFPSPVVDLRLSRGCAWGRCRFCAITTHAEQYEAGQVSRVITAMKNAHHTLNTRFFRLRDDMITPNQLIALSDAIEETLDFQPVWTARTRFSAGLTRSVIRRSRRAGLVELWLGLESAVPEVRERMAKGVSQAHVLRVLQEASEEGLRVRLLTLIGYPGETLDQMNQTLTFLLEHAHQATAGVSLTPFFVAPTAPIASELQLFASPLPPNDRLLLSLPFRSSRLPHRWWDTLKPLAVGRVGPDPFHDTLLDLMRG